MPVDGGIDPDLKDEAAFLYLVPNLSNEYVAPPCAVPLGWLRSVYAAQVAFANESFLDELAHAAGKDPLQYRLQMLAEDKEIAYFDTKWQTARLRGVLQLVGEKSGWDKPLPLGVFAASPPTAASEPTPLRSSKSPCTTATRTSSASWLPSIADRSSTPTFSISNCTAR